MTTFWYAEQLHQYGQYGHTGEREQVYAELDANLEASLNEDGVTHSIVLDLDGPHRYRPSSTPGHGHLIIDRELSWTKYVELLTLLAEIGVLEQNYVNISINRGATFVRTAGTKK